MRSLRARVAAAILVALGAASASAAKAAPAGLRFVEPDAQTGGSQAVVVDAQTLALAHTAQFLPLDSAGRIVGKDDPAAQIEKVLDNVATALAAAGSSLDRAVKVNVYVRRAAVVPEVYKVLARRFAGEVKPALSLVEGVLAHPDALVAMDAVAAAAADGAAVKRFRGASLHASPGRSHAAILPAGPHVYVSGQAAARSDDLPQATRRTLESLAATLKHLGLDESRVVQLKAFLRPMSAVADVEAEIVKFFGDRPAPPIVFVEWISDLPIEIELIAASPRPAVEPVETLEFLTPPGVQASPVYSRVARINRGQVVYVSGLYGKSADKPEIQVRDVFAALGRLLEALGGDLRHMAKATYYITDEETTRRLGELRLKVYDPRRPPAASKAQVSGVGFAGRTVTIDMIAFLPR